MDPNSILGGVGLRGFGGSRNANIKERGGTRKYGGSLFRGSLRCVVSLLAAARTNYCHVSDVFCWLCYVTQSSVVL